MVNTLSGERLSSRGTTERQEWGVVVAMAAEFVVVSFSVCLSVSCLPMMTFAHSRFA